MENIKKLREKTGAGMVDCKKALDEAGGDIEKATEILRKKGIAKAAKRGEREASEGVVKVAVNEAGDEGYILEVNAETDFVARNEKFGDFADSVMALIREKKPVDLNALMDLNIAGEKLADVLAALSGTIGEKISIKRFDIVSGGTVAAYSHQNGRIGVLVAINESGQGDLAYDMGMQIAAANPRYLNPEAVPAEEIEKEKEIYAEQLKRENKPEAMIEKIMEGKIKKYCEEICLLEQEYIKDDKKKVKDILGKVSVIRFVRYSL